MSDDATRALQAFDAHIDELAEEAGVELDAAERQAILGQSIAGGFSPEATHAAFGEFVEEEYEDDDDEEFEEADDESESGTDRLVRHLNDDLARLSAEEGRRLTSRETEIVARGALEQAERYDMVNAREALDDHYRANPSETRIDMNTAKGRGEFYTQRLSENQPEREVPDEIDMTTSAGRKQYYDARLSGGFSADDFEDAGDETS